MTFRIRHFAVALVLAIPAVNASSQSVFPAYAQYPALMPSRVQSDSSRPVFCDNSQSDYFPEIITQYGGSCAQASGIHYVFTYEINRLLDRPAKGHPENVFSYRWIWHLLNGGHDEGSIASDGIEIVKDAGCITVKDYGNESSDYDFTWPNGYERYLRGMPYKAKSISEINLSTWSGIETLMDYMLDKHDGHKGGGVVSYSLSDLGSNDSHKWGYGTYSGPSSCGINSSINFEGTGGAHAMTLAGYDMAYEKDFDGDGMISDQEKGAFIIVNSWGTWWQSNGKTYMPFYYLLNAGTDRGVNLWDTEAMAIDVEYREPRMCFEVCIDYNSRNDLIFRFGVADGAQAYKPDNKCIIRYPFPANQGGDLVMKGGRFASGSKITMGFDVSGLEKYTDGMKAPCYFLIVNKAVLGKSGYGHVDQVKVHDYRGETETVSSSGAGLMAAITTGTTFVKVPTSPMFKNASGEWYDTCMTSANSMTVSNDHTAYPDWSRPMAVRTATGGDYAKMKVQYDSENSCVKLDITRYE